MTNMLCFVFKSIDGESQQITTTQSSLYRNSEKKKEEGPKISVSISSFVTGLVQDIREFLFPISKVVSPPHTDRHGNVVLPVDHVVYETSQNTNRTNVVYYEDHFNDLPWRCTVGTSADDGIWYNRTDYPGVAMSGMVWLLIIYSGLTVTLLAQNNNLSPIIAGVYCSICSLALACHVKTSLTDPGAVPSSAVPIDNHTTKSILSQQHPLCTKCNAYKPPKSHHCRICNRCISGMDHHCPW